MVEISIRRFTVVYSTSKLASHGGNFAILCHNQTGVSTSRPRCRVSQSYGWL